jgi:hypothetical protein
MKYGGCRVASVLIVAGLVSGCNSSLYQNGAGVELGYETVARHTDTEDGYLQQLCRQAGLVPSGGSGCDPGPAGHSSWSLITQAGLNDIDRRCDNYLAWIDAQKRNVGPLSQQISDTRTATAAILAASGAGVQSLAIVAAAFGLAASSYANYNSRLITQIDQSTLQAIVLNRQQRFRAELAGFEIRDRPSAVFVLRGYLRICMPFTIETEINSTLATLARTGAPPETSLALASPRLADPAAAARAAALGPESRIGETRRRAPQPSIPAYAALFLDYRPDRDSRSSVEAVLRKLCATPEQIASGASRLRTLIEIFEQQEYEQIRDGNLVSLVPRRDGRLDQREVRFITAHSSSEGCGDALNYYEKNAFSDGFVGPGQVAAIAGYLGEQPPAGEGRRPLRAMRDMFERARQCLEPAVRAGTARGELTEAIWRRIAPAPPGQPPNVCPARRR